MVVITQRVDPDHPVLAATVPKLRALAERLDELTVLALAARPVGLPANCRVRTFGARSQLLRGARLEALLVVELVRSPAAVLAHMSPIYARLAAPLAHARGARVLLWYTQWRTNPSLERAVRAVDAVLTVDRRSFPFSSPKVRPIGHGIDLERFRCTSPGESRRLRLVALGRYSEVKDHATMLRALFPVDAELDVYGSCETEADRRLRPELERLATELGLDGRVRLHGPAAPALVPDLLASADALVSATRGGADKVVLEAGASCLPALAASAAFGDLLPDELRFPVGDHHALAERLQALAKRSPLERHELGRELRERVAREHSVETWADRVVEAAGL
jgi:glycosyltransferase involved in cell wall biosynthesis